jgi:energy-coupling factor transporter ATP-binding protein EcfA2
MKITESSQICPYTGLRSFTEEESLYFKGRDEQIDQISAQLEERKFLMLTGASGEGKSSLIYAGLIPNARAGFFKSRYVNWTVVDFRPERSPVRSMAKALADKFSISPGTIETEIRRGFSSLIDLYQNSTFYLADDSEGQNILTEQEKKLKSRNASNLLILVDQFEEFFTNPENYHNDHPSTDSQIVVNLILETARLALQQNLPIYVVCTMRSDYIGQCSSFRGLPEYIGYSQFFVPRLKRKELRQVIEEPATLSGNRISQRLTERLVYDLAEGVDQLPILQHALSQIWLMADRGSDEMDLIHYAMVGGMPAHELPEQDAKIFTEWFGTLPDFQKGFYNSTGLDKVIENHARRLYETASEYYNEANPDGIISIKDAKNIIALAFSCLTKIDNSRAVRNRMTLKEITAVINRTALPLRVVGKVLDIFREEGNSFIRPFKTDDESTHVLAEDTVLDITHESLIRNWGMLNKWANQEYEFYSTFLDLKKQLDRWKAHGKSQGYLLPIGPLSYFENWYAKCNPNVAWINRYLDHGDNSIDTLSQSGKLLDDIREYLRRSARNVAISRAFVKYGAQRIALVVSAAIVILLGGFYIYDAAQKRNDVVVQKVQRESSALLASKVVPNESKAMHLLINERRSTGSLIAYLQTIQDSKEKLALSVYVYSLLNIIDKKYDGPLRKELIEVIEETFKAVETQGDNEFTLARSNEFLLALMYNNYYNPGAVLESLLQQRAASMNSLILTTFKNKLLYKVSVSVSLNEGIQHWLTFGKPTKEQIINLIELISPMTSPAAKETFDVFYPKGSYESNGFRANDYNGGYQTVASLYAAAGNVNGIEWCFDQLKNQPDYFSDRLFNNYANVIGYLYQYGYRASAPSVVAYLTSNFPAILPHIAYRELLTRSGYINPLFRVNFLIRRPQTEEGNLFANLCLSSREQFHAIAEDYQKALATIKDPAEREFALAMSYKRVAMAEHKYHFDRGLSVSTASLDALLDKAWSHYSRLSESELEKQVPLTYYFVTEQRSKEVKRRQIFLYPDYIGGWQSHKYHSDLFLGYTLKKGLFKEAYKTIEDLNQIHFWLASIQEPLLAEVDATNNIYPPNDSILTLAWDQAVRHPAGANFDGNLFAVILSNNAFSKGDTSAAISYYGRLRHDQIVSSGSRYENYNRSYFYNQLMVLAKNLAIVGKVDESVKLIGRMTNTNHRMTAYLYSASSLYDHERDQAAFILLDSAMIGLRAFDPENVPPFLDYRGKAVSLLNQIGGDKYVDIGAEIYREIPEVRKFAATERLVKGIAGSGDYNGAYVSIPATLTEEQDLICRSVILLTAARVYENENKLKGWSALDWFVDYYDDHVLFFGFQ